IGREVAAHAIGADQHHRSDAVVSGAADLVGTCATRRNRVGDRLTDLVDTRLCRVEPEVQVVELLDRPIGPLPARAGFAFDHSDSVVHARLYPGEGRGPGSAEPTSNKLG